MICMEEFDNYKMRQFKCPEIMDYFNAEDSRIQIYILAWIMDFIGKFNQYALIYSFWGRYYIFS